tara:strand:- start:169 stop:816 length:648 start_codon:yes stop_codon:yes gene_type:complete
MNDKNIKATDNANLFWGVIEHFRHSDDNSLCIDIGACYGTYAEKYVSLFENVVCFEANYYLERDLRNRMNKTNHNNYKIYMNGLGQPEDHNTEKLFYAVTWDPRDDPYKAHWRGISSYKRDHLKWWSEKDVNINEITTTVRTLDSYNLAPSFIKIDVEESELDVIMGGIETISKHKPTLQVECIGSMELIKNLGYHLVAQRKCHSALKDNIYVYK